MPEIQPEYATAPQQIPPVVIVGAGPVGVRLAAELARLNPQQPVMLFGEEAWHPYNRVQLSSYLAGDIDDQALQERLASVQGDFSIDMLWRDSLLKQISGFTLLGLSVVLAFVSLRKRVSSITWGGFDGWRLVHVLIGIVTLLVLVAHTGLRMGDNINFYLMFVFSGLILAGAIAGLGTGMQHVLPLSVARRVRSMSVWTHILLLWPLPALLGFHILKTYWY